MSALHQPFREPIRNTIARNLVIAAIAGTVIALLSARSARPIGWPVAVVLALWPTFGGHWIELSYLNWLRIRLPAAPTVQRVARLVTWFVGGCVLGVGVVLTARAVGGAAPMPWPAWWLPGAVFVGLELFVHVGLQLRGKGSFYNGRG